MCSAQADNGQLTSLDALKAWLEEQPATADLTTLAAVVYKTVRAHYTAEYTFHAYQLLAPRGKEAAWDAIYAAESSFLEAEQDAEAERSRKRREASRKAEAARQREHKEEHRRTQDAKAYAERVAKVAEALQCSRRYARMLLSEGTKLPDRAKQLAAILGGQPSAYLRSRIRPGRRVDIPAIFMRINVPGCYFSDFARQADFPTPMAAALNRVRREGNHFAILEDLNEAASKCGVPLETAAQIWSRYKIWRMEMIADIAIDKVAEDLPPAPDNRHLIVRIAED